MSVGHFSDGEIKLEVLDNVRGKDVYIIQSISPPVNDHLMRLLLAADAMRLASARSVTAVIPYLGYARQDRRVRSRRVPISARLVADLIESAGFNRVMTVDLHSDQVQGFFHIPVENVFSSSLIIEHIMKLEDKQAIRIVSPDVGGVGRAQAVAKRVNNRELAIVDKRRATANQVDFMQLIGDVENKNCWIIDDLVDTGNTLSQAAALLKSHGAKSVNAYCTHGLLSGSAVNTIDDSLLDGLFITDSITQSVRSNKITTISIAQLIAEAISRVNNNESLSEIYQC